MDCLNLVPQKNNIRIKEQEGKFVIFNLETSGFHMIEEDAKGVIDKIDGVSAVGEIADYFSKERNIPREELRKDFAAFFKGLELRKIIRFKE